MDLSKYKYFRPSISSINTPQRSSHGGKNSSISLSLDHLNSAKPFISHPFLRAVFISFNPAHSPVPVLGRGGRPFTFPPSHAENTKIPLSFSCASALSFLLSSFRSSLPSFSIRSVRRCISLS